MLSSSFRSGKSAQPPATAIAPQDSEGEEAGAEGRSEPRPGAAAAAAAPGLSFPAPKPGALTERVSRAGRLPIDRLSAQLPPLARHADDPAALALIQDLSLMKLRGPGGCPWLPLPPACRGRQPVRRAGLPGRGSACKPCQSCRFWDDADGERQPEAGTARRLLRGSSPESGRGPAGRDCGSAPSRRAFCSRLSHLLARDGSKARAGGRSATSQPSYRKAPSFLGPSAPRGPGRAILNGSHRGQVNSGQVALQRNPTRKVSPSSWVALP